MAQPIEDDEFDSIAQAQAVDDDEFERLASEGQSMRAPAPPQEKGFLDKLNDVGAAALQGYTYNHGAGFTRALSAPEDALGRALGVPEEAIEAGNRPPEYFKEMSKQHPVAHALGAIASPNPLGKLNAVGALARAGRGALSGGLQGALDTHGEQEDATLGDYAWGTGLGVAGGLGGEALGGTLEAGAKWVKGAADNKILRAIGVTPERMEALERILGRKPTNADTRGAAADAVRERGLLNSGGIEAASDAARLVTKGDGGALAAVVQQLDTLAPAQHLPSPQEAVQQLLPEVQRLRNSGNVDAQRLGLQMAKQLQAYWNKGPKMSFNAFWEMRKELDDLIEKSLNAENANFADILKTKVRDTLEGQMETAARRVSGDLADKYLQSKGRYATSLVLSKGAEEARKAALSGPVQRDGLEAAAQGVKNVALGGQPLRRAAALATQGARMSTSSPALARGLDAVAGTFTPARALDAGQRLGLAVGREAQQERPASMVELASRQTPVQKVRHLLSVSPEAVPAAHREGLTRALEKGEQHLATYLWAKASGGDAEFQRFYNGLLGNSLGTDTSQ